MYDKKELDHVLSKRAAGLRRAHCFFLARVSIAIICNVVQVLDRRVHGTQGSSARSAKGMRREGHSHIATATYTNPKKMKKRQSALRNFLLLLPLHLSISSFQKPHVAQFRLCTLYNMNPSSSSSLSLHSGQSGHSAPSLAPSPATSHPLSPLDGLPFSATSHSPEFLPEYMQTDTQQTNTITQLSNMQDTRPQHISPLESPFAPVHRNVLVRPQISQRYMISEQTNLTSHPHPYGLQFAQMPPMISPMETSYRLHRLEQEVIHLRWASYLLIYAAN